jgi:hypothetical protein
MSSREHLAAGVTATAGFHSPRRRHLAQQGLGQQFSDRMLAGAGGTDEGKAAAETVLGDGGGETIANPVMTDQ